MFTVISCLCAQGAVSFIPHLCRYRVFLESKIVSPKVIMFCPCHNFVLNHLVAEVVCVKLIDGTTIVGALHCGTFAITRRRTLRSAASVI